MRHMTEWAEGIVERYLRAAEEFERVLRTVSPEQWGLPTPCPEWDVRRLVNHMARGDLNYAGLAGGGTGSEFLRLRDADALGDDPVGAYARSVRECAGAFARTGALEQVLDHPLGPVSGRQALAVRTTDSVVHTWDLARAIGADETADAEQIAWVDGHLREIYAGLTLAPGTDAGGRFFAEPQAGSPQGASPRDRLLLRFGRVP